MTVKRKPNPPALQKDMFPARKKLAEAEQHSHVEFKRVGEAIETLGSRLTYMHERVTQLEKALHAHNERIDLIVAQTNDKFTRVENEVADIRSNVQRLAHAVELLNKRSVRGKKEPKKWTSEEYIRLDGEYDLMLHVDGEVDEDVLMGIHNCTVLELNEALAHLRKPGYAS